MTTGLQPMQVSRHATVWELLSTRALARGNAIAIGAPGRAPLSWAALIDQIERTRVALRRFGIGPDDRVATILPDGAEAAVAFLSVCCAAAPAPLNPTYRAAEFSYHLRHLRIKAVLVPEHPDDEILEAARHHGCAIINLVPRNEAAGAFDLRCAIGPAVPDSNLPSPDAVALILQTSGTTSRPKVVPLSHANVCASAHHIAEWLALGTDDRGLVVMPQFHVHGLVRAVLAPLAAGGSVVCAPGFQALHFLQWLEEGRPTWYTAVPTIHQAIVEQAQQTGRAPVPSTLRFIRSGAATLRADLMSALEETFGVPVIQGYGMTEAASQVACNPLPPLARKPGSIGLPAGPEMAVIDQQGRLLGTGEPGEIIVRGPNVMSGYEDNPEANADAFTNGWFRTGDHGYRDQDGYYFLTGRIKEMINRGGQKITPQEIDDVLLAHPAVSQAVAFSVPDARLGETVAAAVVLRPREHVTERQLAEFAARQLAFFKIPERIFFLETLPKGPTGKVKRSMLAEYTGVSAGLPLRRDETQTGNDEPEEFVTSRVMSTAADVLGITSVDGDHSFLHAGGNSVRAMLFAARLSDTFGVELTFLDVFHAPSFVAIARIITDRVLDDLDPVETGRPTDDIESR